MVQEGISVIMPSYLGDYEMSRSNPVPKFIRAVKSFMDQDYPKELCELIIISDACQLTIETYNEHFKDVDNIRLIKKESRSNGYPGEARQMGIDISSFDVITYLDTDDYLLDYRLSLINIHINGKRVIIDRKRMILYEDGIMEDISNANAGTWQITHRKFICKDIKWQDSIERGEDTRFIKSALELIKKNPRRSWNSNKEPYWSYLNKIEKEEGIFCKIGGYVMCHVPSNSKFGPNPTDI